MLNTYHEYFKIIVSSYICCFTAPFLFVRRVKNVRGNGHCWNFVKVQIYQMDTTKSFTCQNTFFQTSLSLLAIPKKELESKDLQYLYLQYQTNTKSHISIFKNFNLLQLYIFPTTTKRFLKESTDSLLIHCGNQLTFQNYMLA